MNRKNASMQIRSFAYDVKEVSDAGIFTGYGSVFGNVDAYGEIVAPGAFTESLADTRAKGRGLPVLWQHRGAEPIGNWDMDSLTEDTHGLRGTGHLWLEAAPYARIAHQGLKTRAISGLSIGYYVRKSTFDEKTRIRTLQQLDLVEISIVTTPANDEARIETIKAKLARGTLPSLREFEEILREQGFSKSQAAAIANGGMRDLVERGGAPSDRDAGVLSALRGISFKF